jgi:nitrite reductase/ring-hydroxylating ferredoxin subunit
LADAPHEEIVMPRFVKVASKQQLEAQSPRCVTVGGKLIALFRLGGEIYALDDICTHEGGPLSEGRVENDEVECPWHGARFKIATGAVCHPPAFENVARYNVRISGDDIELEL